MDGDIGARAARLRPGVLGWGHAVVGLLAAMVCVLLPSLVLMSTGGAQMAAGADGGRFFGPGMLRALLVIGVIAVIIAVVANIFLAVRGEAPNSLAGKLGLGKGAGADLLIIAGAACIAYWATRSLTSAAWIHSVVNSIALAVAFFWSTDHGTVVHGVALVAAPFVALAVMAALSRFVGVARL